MFANVAAFSMCSQREGRRHAFIHNFLEVLVLVSRANEQIQLDSMLEVFHGCYCVCASPHRAIWHFYLCL